MVVETVLKWVDELVLRKGVGLVVCSVDYLVVWMEVLLECGMVFEKGWKLVVR